VDLVKLIPWLAAGLVLARWLAELWLSQLNRSHVLANAGVVPAPLKEVIDPATYANSCRYAVARSRFGQIADTYDTAVLLTVLKLI
jgi:hypothetical protein